MQLALILDLGECRPPPTGYGPKMCANCGRMWTPLTAEQAQYRCTCSERCGRILNGALRRGPKKASPICLECGEAFRPKGNLALSKAKYCSRACAGQARSKDPKMRALLTRIAPLGTKGWTEEGRRRFSIRMTGERTARMGTSWSIGS